MTTIRMSWKALELKAEGHAGGGDYGQDIICAGVSAIIQSLAQYLLRYSHTMWPVIRLEPGSSYIRGRPIPGARKRTREAFRQAMDGLQMIADQHPQNVKIIEEEITLWQSGTD